MRVIAMNCLEFRRHVLTEPDSRDAAYLQHRRACPACATLAAREAQFELRFQRVLHVEPPPGLAARVLLRQSLDRSRDRRAYSLAAGVLLVLTLVGGLLFRTPLPSLEEALVGHIQEEPDSLISASRLSLTQVNHTLKTLSLRAEASLGEVRYAGLCRIRRGEGAHLVLAGTQGPVTVLLMPGESVAERVAFRRDQLHGVILPMGPGSMAIVGGTEAEIQSIEQRLRHAVHGSLS
jgi:hypothetical protein